MSKDINVEQKKAEWLEKNGFNSNMTTFVYAMRNSYEVKEELKEAGFRFNQFLLWHSPTLPEQYVGKCIEVALSQVAELASWGEGNYMPTAKDTVKILCDNLFPEPECTSKWLFEVGDKVKEYRVILKSIRGVDTRFGRTQLVTFEDEAGNILTWWTNVNIMAEIGSTVLLSGTVKEHTEYKSKKSTVLTRCKIKEV